MSKKQLSELLSIPQIKLTTPSVTPQDTTDFSYIWECRPVQPTPIKVACSDPTTTLRHNLKNVFEKSIKISDSDGYAIARTSIVTEIVESYLAGDYEFNLQDYLVD